MRSVILTSFLVLAILVIESDSQAFKMQMQNTLDRLGMGTYLRHVKQSEPWTMCSFTPLQSAFYHLQIFPGTSMLATPTLPKTICEPVKHLVIT